MVETYKPIYLNLGCGSNKLPNYVNVDLYGDPDVVWDLNKFPYPWADNSVDGIEMWHTLEHIPDWWGAFLECVRVMKPGSYFHVRVPHWNSATALTYRDHFHVFSRLSFHGIQEYSHGTSAWAEKEKNTVPLVLDDYRQVPYKEHEWMVRWCPWLLSWCADHLNGYIWEQRFMFRKIGDRNER